jgi:hypothetical protein
MKILVLRLHSSGPEYEEMKKVHYENDDSIFLTYNENLKDQIRYSDRMFEIKAKDTYVPGLLDKTMKALKYFINKIDFDFVVRTNSSTVIDMEELKKTLGEIQQKDVYGGHVFRAIWMNEVGGITPEVFQKIEGTEFVSGTSLILSVSMCLYLLNNEHLLDYSIVDDVAIGLLMKKIGGPNLFLPFYEGNALVSKCCFYRFKSENREQDAAKIANQYSLLKYKTRYNVHSL